jgi:hypothetical protein
VSVPPQHQQGPQGKHSIYRPISSQAAQLIALIGTQDTTWSRHEQIISRSDDQQTATSLRDTSAVTPA